MPDEDLPRSGQEVLRLLRKNAKSPTREALRAKTALSVNTISNAFSGSREPEKSTVAALVRACVALSPKDDLRTYDYWMKRYWRAENQRNAAARVSGRTATVDPATLVAQPSTLLRAEHEIVDFTRRKRERQALEEWRNGDHPWAVRWLHGPGGQGKTRLARQFAADSGAAKWIVVMADGPGASDTAREPVRDTDDKAGLLLVVDYADRRAPDALVDLLDPHASHAKRVRVLLLARSKSDWAALRHRLLKIRADVDRSEMALTALTETVPDRAAAFALARDCFARAYDGGLDPSTIPTPDLDRPDLGLALSLHMAALVAVDAHVRGVAAPTGPADLSSYLLDREESYWVRLRGEGASTTSTHAMRRTVFTACLVGAQPRDVAAAIVAPDPISVLDDHGTCYPPSEPGRVLEPLYPDRLAEDFLALHLLQAPDLPQLRRLLRREDGSVPDYAGRALTYLGAASAPGRWPHVAPVLEHVLRDDPELAGRTRSSAALLGLVHLDPSVLVEIERKFPLRDPASDVGMHAVTEAWVGPLIDRHDESPETAEALGLLVARAANAGATDRAIAVARMVIDRYRRGGRPEDRSAFATTLLVLADILEADGRTDEAEQVAGEGHALTQDLAGEDPGTYEPQLVASLATLGRIVAGVGRFDEALPLLEEAVTLAERLDGAAPMGGFLLAAALTNLAGSLSAADRDADALPVFERSVRVWRAIVAEDRPSYLGGLATALTHLGISYEQVGRTSEGARVNAEALELGREHVGDDPAVHVVQHIQNLDFGSLQKEEEGDFDEAAQLAAESVELNRELVAAGKDRSDELAASLTQLGSLLDGLGRGGEVWPLLDEAATLVLARPSGSTPTRPSRRKLAVHRFVVEELDALGDRLGAAERPEEAATARARAIEVCRRLAHHEVADEPLLARVLGRFSMDLLDAGRVVDAVAPAQESVRLHRAISAVEPATTTELRNALALHGTCLALTEQWGPAVDVLEEVLDGYRAGAAAADTSPLLGTLQMIFGACVRLNRFAEIVALGEEWLEPVRGFVADDPSSLPAYVNLTSLHAQALVVEGRTDAGIAAADQALSAVRAMNANTDTEVALATAMHVAAFARYHADEDLTAASALSEASVAQLRALVESAPPYAAPLHAADLHRALILRAELLEALDRPDEAAEVREELAERAR